MKSGVPEAVVIGVSAGALEALTQVLPAVPEDCPFPILVVVHVPGDKESMLAPLLQQKCRVAVCEAEDKEVIAPATVYFAPPDYHLQVEKDRSISLSSDEPVLFSRPSIDVLFETAADAYGSGLAAIVLTGANSDGAEGLRAVARAGGRAFVQNPAEAAVPTMPEAALAACPQATQLSLADIAEFLAMSQRTEGV